MKSATAVLSVVCLLAVFQSCNSLKCYQCNDSNKGCDKITEDKYLKDCPAKLDGCAMITLSRNGKIDLLSRYCEPKGSKVVFDTCSTDKCNGKDGVNSTSEGTVKGDTIKCYTCVGGGKYHEQCEKIVDDKHLKECKSGEECVKLASINADDTYQFLFRGCIPKGYKLDKQVHCATDKCNKKDEVVATKTENEFNLPKIFKHGFQ